jgi:hypothetical protein
MQNLQNLCYELTLLFNVYVANFCKSFLVCCRSVTVHFSFNLLELNNAIQVI